MCQILQHFKLTYSLEKPDLVPKQKITVLKKQNSVATNDIAININVKMETRTS